MQIFLDTANIEEIKKANELGILDGVTTNPSKISEVCREIESFKSLIKEICRIVFGPVSVEAMSLETGPMVKEAREIGGWAPNVVVKVPMTPAGIKAVIILEKEGVKTNVTMVSQANQALLAAKAGATYISIFIGRLDAIGHDGMQVARDVQAIIKNYGFKSKIILGSMRHPLHILEAAKAGIDIVTVQYQLLMQLYQHPLTDFGIEKFSEDWRKVREGGGR